MIGWWLSESLCNILGFVYPAYKSYKALNTDDDTDDTQWLTYWIVYSFITVIEYYLGFFISWLPFYYEAKILLVLWLIHPALKGATLIYHLNIKPLLESREMTIDSILKDFSFSVSSNVAPALAPTTPDATITVVAEAEKKKDGDSATTTTTTTTTTTEVGSAQVVASDTN